MHRAKYRNPIQSPGEVISAKKQTASPVSGKLAEIVRPTKISPPGYQAKSPHFKWLPPSKNPHHLEASQIICIANRLIGFHKRQAPTVRYFQTDYVWPVLCMTCLRLHGQFFGYKNLFFTFNSLTEVHSL